MAKVKVSSRASIRSLDLLRAARRSSAQPRRTSRYFGRKSLEPTPGINVLAATDHIFIYPISKDSAVESSNLYHLVNEDGHTIFTAVKTFHYENCDKLLEFDVTILEPNGGGLLSIKGDSENISICSLEFNGTLKELVGSIHCPQVRSFFSWKANTRSKHIYVRDSNWADQFILQPSGVSTEVNGEFNVVLANQPKTKTGNLSKSWPAFANLMEKGEENETGEGETEGEEEVESNDSASSDLDKPSLSKLYGIHFMPEMDVNSKALLMAALLFVYFQTFDSNHRQRKGVMNNFQAKCCAVFSILIFCFTLLLVTAITTYTATH